jgi:hypothetical protein
VASKALVLEDGDTDNQKSMSISVNNFLFVSETGRKYFALYKELMDIHQ